MQPVAVRAVALPARVQLRPGRAADRPAFLRGILREKLNPLSLDPARFTVAERTDGGSGGGGQVVGFGQIKPLGGCALELSTLIVAEEERGKGVGSALIHSLSAQAGDTPLYLTTIASQAPLYQRCGFEEVARDQVPPFLLAEYLVGLLLAWLVTRQRLVLMRLAAGGGGGGQQAEQLRQDSGGEHG